MKNAISRPALAKLESLDDTGKTLREFIDLFKSTAPAALKELKKNCAAKKAKELQGTAHQFKSSCAYLGALGMAQACASIEELSAKEEFSKAAVLIEQLVADYDSASAELTRYFKEKSGKAKR